MVVYSFLLVRFPSRFMFTNVYQCTEYVFSNTTKRKGPFEDRGDPSKGGRPRSWSFLFERRWNLLLPSAQMGSRGFFPPAIAQLLRFLIRMSHRESRLNHFFSPFFSNALLEERKRLAGEVWWCNVRLYWGVRWNDRFAKEKGKRTEFLFACEFIDVCGLSLPRKARARRFETFCSVFSNYSVFFLSRQRACFRKTLKALLVNGYLAIDSLNL